MDASRTVGVVGLGTTGAGVAEVLARAGHPVLVLDRDAEGTARGLERVRRSTDRAVAGGKIDAAARDAALARIRPVAGAGELAAADLVVEAVPEDAALKREVLAALDRACRPGAVLATATSSLSVTALSTATSRPSRVLGAHFFTPVPVRGFVEVVRTVASDPDAVTLLVDVARGAGVEPAVVGDRAGFVANALLLGYLNHAVTMVEQGYATRDDVDAAMRTGCGLPMGPLALVDLVGLDTVLVVLESMYHQDRDRRHAPAPLLRQMVTAGLLGRKSGQGFYRYAEPGSSRVVDAAPPPGAGDADTAARTVARAAVLGSGTMAAGIVEVLARAGVEVRGVARSAGSADRLLARVAGSLQRAVDRGRLAADRRDEVLARVSVGDDEGAAGDVDLALEAVVEDVAVKRALFARLDAVCRPGTLLATTTSSLPVVECAMATGRPEDVLGLHFFNPAPAMRLVEVVRTVRTSPQAVRDGVALCHRLGRRPVVCGDRAGFVVNALLFPYLNDAVRLLAEHYADADGVDAAMRLGCAYPMGPFELLDVVGLDVSLAIQETLYREFREPGYAPVPLLEHLVRAGYLGRKTGRGFRVHDRGRARA